MDDWWMLGSPFFTSEGVVDIVTNALYGTAEERKLACAELEDSLSLIYGSCRLLDVPSKNESYK